MAKKNLNKKVLNSKKANLKLNKAKNHAKSVFNSDTIAGLHHQIPGKDLKLALEYTARNGKIIRPTKNATAEAKHHALKVLSQHPQLGDILRTLLNPLSNLERQFMSHEKGQNVLARVMSDKHFSNHEASLAKELVKVENHMKGVKPSATVKKLAKGTDFNNDQLFTKDEYEKAIKEVNADYKKIANQQIKAILKSYKKQNSKKSSKKSGK